MKALVVYESIFGNTKTIAEAIARGLSASFETALAEVASAPEDVGDIDLVVVGGPTHAFSMSRPTTRESGRHQAEEQGLDPVSDTIGIREWLNGAAGRSGTMAATFDTGAGKLGFISAGSAAKGADKRLDHLGFRMLADPQQFLIQMVDGKTFLKDGEEARAEAWGAELGRVAQQ